MWLRSAAPPLLRAAATAHGNALPGTSNVSSHLATAVRQLSAAARDPLKDLGLAHEDHRQQPSAATAVRQLSAAARDPLKKLGLAHVDHIVAVSSAKGGVGKSTTAGKSSASAVVAHTMHKQQWRATLCAWGRAQARMIAPLPSN